MKTFILVSALAMISGNCISQPEEWSWQQFRDSMNTLERDSLYSAAMQLLLDNRNTFRDEWFSLSKEEIYLNEKLGSPEANLEIFKEGHDKGYFYLIHPDLPKYKPYSDFPGFSEITDTDRELRDLNNENSRMLFDVVTPVVYDERKEYPVIIIFHGGGSNLHRVRMHWNNKQLEEQFLRVYVQNYLYYDSETFGWRSGDEKAFDQLKDLFAEFQQNYRIKNDSIILAGISAGGTFAIDIAVRQIIPASGFLTFCPGMPMILGPEHIHGIKDVDVRGFMLGGASDYYLERQKQMMRVFEDIGIICHHEIVQGMGHAYPENENEWIDEALQILERSPDPSYQYALPAIDIEYLKVIQGVEHSLPICDYLFGHPYEIPFFSDNLFHAFAGSERNVTEMFHYANALLSSKAGGFGPPLSGTWKGKSIQAEDDIDHFFMLEGVEIIHPEEWNKLPFSFRRGIIEFLYYVDRAKTGIDEYIYPVIKHLGLEEYNTRNEIMERLMIPWQNRELDSWETIEIIQQADARILSYASRLASEKLHWFFSLTNLSIPGDFTGCTIISCLGECQINGTGNDTLAGDKFCVIELGGDDVYYGNTASPKSLYQPVGIVVDLGGNDKYLCGDHFLVSGILGLAFLLDLEGDDFYQTRQPGMAFSLYGTSLLYDLAGDDVYFAESPYAQASSFLGTSLLVDISGRDRYSSSSFSQGFGGTKGVSVFYDGKGDDYYNPLETSTSNQDQLPAFVQGSAKGRWAEATDGQSLAGGIGLFFDHSGTDTYNARSFSQGASYYFGLGVFSDGSGNDTYNAVSHSQGYAAHYSLASFIESGGDDCYNENSDTEKLTQIIGGGRDHSAGLFIERQGDDVYHIGNRSAGIGDLNGIGILKDAAGNDIYHWHKNHVNDGSPSFGTTIAEGPGTGLTFKAVSQENFAKGMFYDSNGDKMVK